MYGGRLSWWAVVVAEAGGEKGKKSLRICIVQQRTRIAFFLSISYRIHTTLTTFRIAVESITMAMGIAIYFEMTTGRG